ncbi:MAG: NUDIX domain-containing protein [Methanocalculaceae archaeon]|nr:NUDIX domain-containing protein [Methanocalculaceae archaeon]
MKIATKPVHLPSGSDREFLFVEPVSTVCILLTDETSVYLIRQYWAVFGSYIYGVLAGGVEAEDSDPIHVARRELAEEARLAAAEPFPGDLCTHRQAFAQRSCGCMRRRPFSVRDVFLRRR